MTPGWFDRSTSEGGEFRSLLIASTYFPPRVGGISSMMAAIVHALGEERVCCLTGIRSDGRSTTGDEGRRVYRRPWAFAKSKPTQAVGWGLAVLEIMARERPRAVQLSTVYDGYLGVWLKRRLGLPFLVYAHGNEILDVLRRPGQSRAGRALTEADRIVANSHYTAELTRRAGAAGEKIRVVHPGCDATRFRPVEVSPDTRSRILGGRAAGPVLLSVGNLVERKGHDMVLRSLPRLLDLAPDLVYLVAGDGPQRRSLERAAASLGVENHVVFAGQVPGHLLPEVYSLASVFVLPSREELDSCDVEGFGMVFLEANACGVPVVAGRSGGIPDAVNEGVTGVLVDPRNAEEIAGAIAGLLSEPERARRMGARGRERVLRDFQWSDAAAAIQQVMREIVEDSDRTPLD